MRKTPLIMLGVAAGMALTFVATQSYVALGGTDPRLLAAPTNYRLLDVFGVTGATQVRNPALVRELLANLKLA